MNSITPKHDTEALLHEKLQALLADLDTAGNNAEYGHVLDDMDDFLFLHGRKFLTEILSQNPGTHQRRRKNRRSKTMSPLQKNESP
ncbi:MAG: hypothetical protein LBT46_12425 [Planctomycetaceae bacterium]|jgi:hypothetical protein|nr:hypothetical protein [Planctomycetaceae bacterium]